jgi:hypothetical protein
MNSQPYTPGTVKLWASPGRAGDLPKGNYFRTVKVSHDYLMKKAFHNNSRN